MSYLENVRKLLEYHGEVRREVYLDLENSAPVPSEVLNEMLPYFNSRAYGNPTLTHKQGWEAYEAIMEAADTIAKSIGASPEELCFTSGEAEANNTAILGSLLDKKGKIVTSAIDPLTILLPLEILKRRGFEIVRVSVDSEGFIDLDEFSKAIDKDTVLVSTSIVNNEIGTIQPFKEIVEIAKDKNPDVIVHMDASDAYGRVMFSVRELNIDLLTLSSYKIMGPRGVAALYVRNGIRVERIIEGPVGTQRLWPGVENTPLIVGFKKASQLAFERFEENVNHMKKLRDMLIKELLSIEDTLINGPLGDKRAPDNVNISFLHCEGESLTIELSFRGVYVSSGSACTRRILQPSHVLIAIGREYEAAHGSILMKVSRYHSVDDIEYVIESFKPAVERIRSISPMGRK
ncbi:MAG: cysteine desulfurase family protein [Thermoproteota archaeon]|nr:cysteine desulfurase [Candidatus Brockarchaeota archaeon]